MDGRTGFAEQLSAALEYKNAFSSYLPTQEAHKKVSKILGGRTPLSCAVEGGNTEIVRMLLENGEDVNEKDADGSESTPLHWAAYMEPLKNLELLLQQEARQGPQDRPALLVAAASGRCEDVAMLLEYGANVNASSAEGVTALDCAAIQGSVEMVQLLLDHNAKIDTQGFHNLTSLDQ
ncbi:hypothetical protein ASPBRDRAFT_82568, partial [Aspergillus brasiliensis CBS 101740]